MSCGRNFQKTEVEKRVILEKNAERGCRITKQRMTILDVMLSRNVPAVRNLLLRCQKGQRYRTGNSLRMLNVLEEEGIISRSNMYRITAAQEG